MTYFHISGINKSYSIFTRSTEATYPFISSLYRGTGSRNNVQSWKTEAGARKFVARKFPDWVEESPEEFRQREAEYKRQKQLATTQSFT